MAEQEGQDEQDKQDKQEKKGGVWIWLGADGRRWRIQKTREGFWSCRIGDTGKRLSEWQPGLPPDLGAMPKGLKDSPA
ncbi:MAG: hypothetical protein ACREI3_04015 [Nitrospirales bacterium]